MFSINLIRAIIKNLVKPIIIKHPKGFKWWESRRNAMLGPRFPLPHNIPALEVNFDDLIQLSPNKQENISS